MGLMDKMKDAAAQVVSQAQQSLDKTRDGQPTSHADSPVIADAVAAPLLELVSHIEGKNAKVRLWPDRIEWERPRGVSAGKMTAAAFTAGASLLVTGVKGGKDEYDVVLIKHVTNVSTRKDGLMYYAVDVQTSAGAAVNTISFRVNKDEAVEFRTAILNAMRAVDERTSAPMVVTQAATEPTVAADPTAQLQQLAALRDAGILTEEEFAAKKAELLARI